MTDVPSWSGSTSAGNTAVALHDLAALRPRPNTSLGVSHLSMVRGHSPPPVQAESSYDNGGSQRIINQDAEQALDPNDVRLQPAYAEWYYSQNPRDPRAPPPLTGLGRYGLHSGQRGSTPPPPAVDRSNPADATEPSSNPTHTPPRQNTATAVRERAKPVPMNPNSVTAVYGPSLSVVPSPGKPLFASDLLTPMAGAYDVPSVHYLSAQSALAQYQAAAAAVMASPYATPQMQLYPQMSALYSAGMMTNQDQYEQFYYHQMQAQFNGDLRGRRGRGNAGILNNPYVGPLSYAQQEEVLQQQQRAFMEMAASTAQGGVDYYGGGGGGEYRSDQRSRPLPTGRGRGDGPNDLARGGVRGSRGRGRGAAPPRISRSPFMMEFHENHDHWGIRNVLGNAVELAKDQEGSRFIQHLLDPRSPQANRTDDQRSGVDAELIDQLFDEVLVDATPLMEDVFGNYVIQKMLDVATLKQLQKLASRFQGNVLRLTLHTFGCRVVQKAIQLFDDAGRQMILQELRNHVAQCVQDQNGNHVIQKAIEYIPGETDFVITAFLGRVHEFATHAYGCRVIQCLFAHSPRRQDAVLAEIVSHVHELSLDQFGNYVVQHILQTAPEHDVAVESIIRALQPTFFEYALHKFASNVMEKVYQRSSRQVRLDTVKQLCLPPTGNAKSDEPPVSALVTMVKDQFGNYVVQRMIDHSTDQMERELILGAIRPHIHELRRLTFGKHIIARLERCATDGGKEAPTAGQH